MNRPKDIRKAKNQNENRINHSKHHVLVFSILLENHKDWYKDWNELIDCCNKFGLKNPL